ncbi:hypothetical protein VN1338_21800 [Helicobacter pylori]
MVRTLPTHKDAARYLGRFNDAASCRVLDESARGVDGPVIGDCDEFDAKLFAFVEKCLVVVGL